MNADWSNFRHSPVIQSEHEFRAQHKHVGDVPEIFRTNGGGCDVLQVEPVASEAFKTIETEQTALFFVTICRQRNFSRMHENSPANSFSVSNRCYASV